MNGCKRYSLLTVLIVLALLLTGCGGANVTEEEAAEEVPTAETDANSGPESTSSDTSSVEAEMAEAMEQEVAEAEATTTPTSDAVLEAASVVYEPFALTDFGLNYPYPEVCIPGNAISTMVTSSFEQADEIADASPFRSLNPEQVATRSYLYENPVGDTFAIHLATNSAREYLLDRLMEELAVCLEGYVLPFDWENRRWPDAEALLPQDYDVTVASRLVENLGVQLAGQLSLMLSDRLWELFDGDIPPEIEDEVSQLTYEDLRDYSSPEIPTLSATELVSVATSAVQESSLLEDRLIANQFWWDDDQDFDVDQGKAFLTGLAISMLVPPDDVTTMLAIEPETIYLSIEPTKLRTEDYDLVDLAEYGEGEIVIYSVIDPYVPPSLIFYDCNAKNGQFNVLFFDADNEQDDRIRFFFNGPAGIDEWPSPEIKQNKDLWTKSPYYSVPGTYTAEVEAAIGGGTFLTSGMSSYVFSSWRGIGARCSAK